MVVAEKYNKGVIKLFKTELKVLFEKDKFSVDYANIN